MVSKTMVQIAGIEVEPSSYPIGFVIERTEDYVIEVRKMIFNWRLVVYLPEMDGLAYEHGYCYFGTDSSALVKAVIAGKAWADPLNTAPVGFDKKAY